MITWGQARLHVAGLYGASAWDNLQPAPKRICHAAIQQALETCWRAMHPDARTHEGNIEVKSRIVLTSAVTATEGDNYVTVISSDVDGTVQGQQLYFESESHRIDQVEDAGGGSWKLWLREPVRDSVSSETGFIDHTRYILPIDFESFAEIPAAPIPMTETAEADQYYSSADYQISVHGWVNDYISPAGTVKIDQSGGMTRILGQATAWTTELRNQVMRVYDQPMLIRDVNVVSQYAYPWDPYVTKLGGGTESTAVDYYLDLQMRRWCRIYSASIRDIHFTYLCLPPRNGRDEDTIPLPVVGPFYDWVKYYWMGGDAACGASASDIAAAYTVASRSLADVYHASRPYAALPVQMQVDLRRAPNVRHVDTRVGYYRTNADGEVSYSEDQPVSRRAR